MVAAVQKYLHPLARTPNAISALKKDSKEKVAKNQCRIIAW